MQLGIPDHALVPHGFSVILNAPAVFTFTRPQRNPERHLEAATALGADVSRCRKDDAGRVLADRITWFMQRLNVPERPCRRRLLIVGYPRADRGNAGAGAADEAVAAFG